MKKYVVFLLSAAMMLLLAVAASAATCTHNWRIDYDKCIAATCEKDGKNVYACSRCSETKSETVAKMGHDFVKAEETPASCAEKGVITERCSVCGEEKKTETEALGHKYKVTASTKATCTEGGSETSKCSVCGDVKTEEIEALGHDFSKFISSSATCTTRGDTTYQCTRCKEITLKSVTKLGHDYEETGGPTCTQSGKITYTCKRCNHSYQSTTKRALGHELPDKDSSLWRVVTKATCEKEGTCRAKCTRCKTYVTETIPKTEHAYGTTKYLFKVPTASSTGKYSVTCKYCGDAFEKTISRGTTDLSDYSVPAVTASVDGGYVDAGTTVKLSCALSGATIYYTTNGKSPKTSASAKVYANPIEIDSSCTVRAYALFESGDVQVESSTMNRTYKVKGEDTWLYLMEDASLGGYMDLEAGNRFRPDDKATRYEVIAAMDRLFGSWTDDAEIDFTDVSEEYKDAVAKFVGAELIDGYGDKTFRGEANIKRGELCKLLVLALGMDPDDAGVLAFGDVPVSHWAYDYIALLTEAEYLKGDTEGNFRPEDNLTRAELATVMNRIADISGTGGVPIADVAPSHWAYAYVCAAVEAK